MMPRGMGFVKVPTKYQQGLGRGRQIDEDGSEYGVTVFHQLHCLAMIRATINSLRSKDTDDGGSGGVDIVHADHCIDYIRQVRTSQLSHPYAETAVSNHQSPIKGLMCSADLTIEHYGWSDDGKLAQAVDGWFISHTCKDWDQIVQFATAHRSRNESGII